MLGLEPIRLAGGEPVVVQTDVTSGFKATVDQLEAARTAKTKALVFVSPSNPTGATLSSSQARDLVELCRRHGLRLICDEAYTDFRFSADSQRLPAEFDPDLLVPNPRRSFLGLAIEPFSNEDEDKLEEALAKLQAMIPAGRIGEPDEIAHTVQYLVENDFVNGRNIEVDGAMRL
mgnify:CR=1 FL=1